MKTDGVKNLQRHQHLEVFYQLTKLFKWTLSYHTMLQSYGKTV